MAHGERRASKGESWQTETEHQGSVLLFVGCKHEVRDNSRRYSAVEKYKLNPAATAIEIWNHIVSIYHSRLLRRVLEPHTLRHLPAECVRLSRGYKWMIPRIIAGRKCLREERTRDAFHRGRNVGDFLSVRR